MSTTPADYYTNRDQYGRTNLHSATKRGVIVTMPKRTAHVRPAGGNYMVNLWDPQNPGAVTYFAKRADAIAFHAANAANHR